MREDELYMHIFIQLLGEHIKIHIHICIRPCLFAGKWFFLESGFLGK